MAPHGDIKKSSLPIVVLLFIKKNTYTASFKI